MVVVGLYGGVVICSYSHQSNILGNIFYISSRTCFSHAFMPASFIDALQPSTTRYTLPITVFKCTLVRVSAAVHAPTPVHLSVCINNACSVCVFHEIHCRRQQCHSRPILCIIGEEVSPRTHIHARSSLAADSRFVSSSSLLFFHP